MAMLGYHWKNLFKGKRKAAIWIQVRNTNLNYNNQYWLDTKDAALNRNGRYKRMAEKETKIN